MTASGSTDPNKTGRWDAADLRYNARREWAFWWLWVAVGVLSVGGVICALLWRG